MHARAHWIVIPAYNERDNLALLVDAIVRLGMGSKIIIVDDSSPDGTGELADQLATQQVGVNVIHRPRKMGLGTAQIAGIGKALSESADRIITMDADFSHSPRYLPDVLHALERWDVVTGSRYVAGGGTLNCTLPRRTLSRGANAVAHLALDLHASDATVGFRGYRREVLESIPLGPIISNGYSFLIEMLYYCQLAGWSIGEIPIVFENRKRGASKISRCEIARAMQTVLRLTLHRTFGRVPIPGLDRPGGISIE